MSEATILQADGWNPAHGAWWHEDHTGFVVLRSGLWRASPSYFKKSQPQPDLKTAMSVASGSVV